jgi:2-iminobutanoate/2-iminopropanoate deaminase
MPRTVIATEMAPRAIGPYVQAVRAGNLLFCSGQLGVDPTSGKLVDDKDVAAQARQALANLSAVLTAADASLSAIVKATIFLIDMGDFEAVNKVYADAMGTTLPARSTVAVAGLPRGARVEIEAIAALD